MKTGLAHAIAIAAGFLAIVLVSAGWIMHLRTGPKLGAWVAGPMIIGVPFALVVLSVIWLAARFIAARWITWGALTVVLATALGAYIIAAITCGPVACFQQGPNRALGWFVVGGVALVAMVHHFVLNVLRQGARDGRH